MLWLATRGSQAASASGLSLAFGGFLARIAGHLKTGIESTGNRS